MGYDRFKLSDMIPNNWFFKPKETKTTNKRSQCVPSYMLNKHHLSPPPPPPPSPPPLSFEQTSRIPEPQCQSRKSYHITRELTIDLAKTSPRKSNSNSKSRRLLSSRRSSTTSSCSCQSTFTSQSSGSKSRSPASPPLVSKETNVVSSTVENVGFLVEDALLKFKALYADNKQSMLDHIDDNNKAEHYTPRLAPIITRRNVQTPKNYIEKGNMKPNNSPPSRKLTSNSVGGVRLKVNSPRIIGRKQGQNGNKNGGRRSSSSKKRRSISESFAVVKSSFDPHKDFKESMVEMIVQNNLTASKDLENLLACYLSLNSDEYHEVIIQVFKQIWFDFRHHQQ